jgi:predicted RNase H-like nuclease (RuvC/YqgF family)
MKSYIFFSLSLVLVKSQYLPSRLNNDISFGPGSGDVNRSRILNLQGTGDANKQPTNTAPPRMNLSNILSQPFRPNVSLEQQKENLLNALNADKQRNQNIENLQKQVQTDLKNDAVSKEALLNHVNALNKAKTIDTQKDKQLNSTLAKGIHGPITKPFIMNGNQGPLLRQAAGSGQQKAQASSNSAGGVKTNSNASVKSTSSTKSSAPKTSAK